MAGATLKQRELWSQPLALPFKEARAGQGGPRRAECLDTGPRRGGGASWQSQGFLAHRAVGSHFPEVGGGSEGGRVWG